LGRDALEFRGDFAKLESKTLIEKLHEAAHRVDFCGRTLRAWRFKKSIEI